LILLILIIFYLISRLSSSSYSLILIN